MDAMVSMLLVLALAFVTQTVPKPAPPPTSAPADTVQVAALARPDSLRIRISFEP